MKGEIVRELRLEKKLTQKQLGAVIDVAESTIRMIEIGKRDASMEVAKKLADFFDCSIDYLEGRTDIKNNKLIINKLLEKLLAEKVITDVNDIDVELIGKLRSELNK